MQGKRDAIYAWLTTAEDFLQMVGLLIFLYALLTYASERLAGARVTIGDAPRSRDAEAGRGNRVEAPTLLPH